MDNSKTWQSHFGCDAEKRWRQNSKILIFIKKKESKFDGLPLYVHVYVDFSRVSFVRLCV